MNNLSLSSPHGELSRLVYPLSWIYRKPVPGTYIVYKPSFTLALTYLFRVGVLNLLAKILSRFSEKHRNSKVFGVGLGICFDSANKSLGETCLFFTPSADKDSFIFCHPSHILSLGFSLNSDVRFDFSNLPFGINRFSNFNDIVFYSGRQLYSQSLVSALASIRSFLITEYPTIYSNKPVCFDTDTGSDFNSISIPSYQTCSLPAIDISPPNKTAVLFGLGNYAKTVIIPSISSNLALQRVHEIDPSQLSSLYCSGRQVSTSPIPIDDHFFHAWFIAGFQHTHVDLSLQALKVVHML